MFYLVIPTTQLQQDFPVVAWSVTLKVKQKQDPRWEREGKKKNGGVEQDCWPANKPLKSNPKGAFSRGHWTFFVFSLYYFSLIKENKVSAGMLENTKKSSILFLPKWVTRNPNEIQIRKKDWWKEIKYTRLIHPTIILI